MIKRLRNITAILSILLFGLGLLAILSAGNDIFHDPDFITSWRPIAFRFLVKAGFVTAIISTLLFIYPFFSTIFSQSSHDNSL